jgi:hypothetical protein
VRFGLRAKVVAVALVLAPIPWLGYRYVKEMEAVLREGQEQALVATARAVATALHDRPELLDLRPGVAASGEMERILRSLGRADLRIWIVDRQERLLAIAGGLQKKAVAPHREDGLDLLARALRPVTTRCRNRRSPAPARCARRCRAWRAGAGATRPTRAR